MLAFTEIGWLYARFNLKVHGDNDASPHDPSHVAIIQRMSEAAVALPERSSPSISEWEFSDAAHSIYALSTWLTPESRSFSAEERQATSVLLHAFEKAYA